VLSRPMLSDFQSSRKSVAEASCSCRSPQREHAARRWTFLFAVAQTKTVLDGVRRKGLAKDGLVVVYPSQSERPRARFSRRLVGRKSSRAMQRPCETSACSRRLTVL